MGMGSRRVDCWFLARKVPFSSDLEGGEGQRFAWEARASNGFLILD